MMRCCILSCDTDENVVNSTSAFFVGFPTDPVLHRKWINILVTNHLLLDEYINERTKICSCHFGEEDFGKHPVHGYRFLLPTAVPSIFTLIEEDSSTNLVLSDIDANDLVADESNLAAFTESKQTIYEIKQPPEDFEPDNMSATSMSDLEQTTETIGIEYANGKYYFLQSDDECADDLIEQDDKSDCRTVASFLLPNSASYNQIESSNTITGNDFDNSTLPNSDSDLKQTEIGPASPTDQIVEETCADSMIQFASSVEPSECSSTNYSELKSVTELVLVKEELNDGNDSLIEFVEDDGLATTGARSPETEYGTVEMLEEDESQSTVRRRGARIDKHFCKTCGKGFPYESGLKKHEFVHNGEKPHTCGICGKGFSQKVNLTIHSRRHTGEETVKKFACPFCDKKCTRMSELKVHVKTHWRKMPHPCQLCMERFAEVTTYYEHLKTQHKDELTLQECIDMIAQSENAELIVQNDSYSVSGDDGSFICAVCLKTFRNERLLRKHKRKIHPKVFVCSECPKRFLYKSLLDKHMRVHTQEKPFQCQQCERSFSQKVNLEVHLFKRHNIRVRNALRKTNTCEFCNKVFDRPSTLQVHIRTHTKERPFFCSDCPKTFVSNSALASHIKYNHRGESLLLQPSQRNSADKSDNISLNTCDESTDATNMILVASGDDTQMVQYSIEFFNSIESVSSLCNNDTI
ncbi:zinc finger protein 85-like [Malaya genurostris]|uniref:zinc finger protein 85-like n=1 Tax=Malaya genurostris TaxID=325434 RepID=UPI0026F3B2B9|nr:zinc finger protein 85-like [Malaya genurostris]